MTEPECFTFFRKELVPLGSSKEASEHLFVSLLFYCSVMKQTALECEERSSRVVSGTRQVATGNSDVKDRLKCETGTVMGWAFVPPTCTL